VIATDTTSVSLPGTAGVNDSSEARSGVGTAGDSSATR